MPCKFLLYAVYPSMIVTKNYWINTNLIKYGFFYITIFSNSNYINNLTAYHSNTANIQIEKDDFYKNKFIFKSIIYINNAK